MTAHQNPNHYEVITMTETRTAQYEGMFLFPQSAVADLQGTVESVKQMLTARGATICSIPKWDERRLAYDIAGNKRGLYILAYFTAPTAALKELERDCNLNERLLRSMVTRADHLTTEQMNDAEGQAKLAMEMKLRRPDGDEATEAMAAPAPAAE